MVKKITDFIYAGYGERVRKMFMNSFDEMFPKRLKDIEGIAEDVRENVYEWPGYLKGTDFKKYMDKLRRIFGESPDTAREVARQTGKWKYEIKFNCEEDNDRGPKDKNDYMMILEDMHALSKRSGELSLKAAKKSTELIRQWGWGSFRTLMLYANAMARYNKGVASRFLDDAPGMLRNFGRHSPDFAGESYAAASPEANDLRLVAEDIITVCKEGYRRYEPAVAFNKYDKIKRVLVDSDYDLNDYIGNMADEYSEFSVEAREARKNTLPWSPVFSGHARF